MNTVEQLKRRITALRETLKAYANESNWYPVQITSTQTRVTLRKGEANKLAKMALQKDDELAQEEPAS